MKMDPMGAVSRRIGTTSKCGQVAQRIEDAFFLVHANMKDGNDVV